MKYGLLGDLGLLGNIGGIPSPGVPPGFGAIVPLFF